LKEIEEYGVLEDTLGNKGSRAVNYHHNLIASQKRKPKQIWNILTTDDGGEPKHERAVAREVETIRKNPDCER
jgi:hypothetical protein